VLGSRAAHKIRGCGTFAKRALDPRFGTNVEREACVRADPSAAW
jgi:hypothetical protein